MSFDKYYPKRKDWREPYASQNDLIAVVDLGEIVDIVKEIVYILPERKLFV